MLAFAMAGRGELLGCHVEKDTINLTAYATRDAQGTIYLTVINRTYARCCGPVPVSQRLGCRRGVSTERFVDRCESRRYFRGLRRC